MLSNESLFKTLKNYIENGSCFTAEVRNTLIEYRNSGKSKESAEEVVKQLKVAFAGNEVLQGRLDDILDIVTGWCSPNMRVWD